MDWSAMMPIFAASVLRPGRLADMSSCGSIGHAECGRFLSSTHAAGFVVADISHLERLSMRILIVLLAFAAFNLLTLTTPEAAKQNLAAWTSLAGRR